MLIALCVWLFSLGSSHAVTDRWAALAMVESGCNDRVIGRAGEVSRYQIKPAVWRAAQPAWDDPLNPWAALRVAQSIMRERSAAFEQRFHRAPNNFEFYVLWNAPAQLIGTRRNAAVTKTVAARAQRYSNLVGEQP